MSAAQATSTPPNSPNSGWLYGPAVDLLLGCGLAYVLSVPLLMWVAVATGISAWPATLATLLALLVSTPHYGATLLRVYEHRHDRRRYAIFAIWITAGLVGCFVVGVKSALVGSLLVTIYVTWSPWHYAGQNYGLAVMFLRRRGVEIRPGVKRLLYASFILSFVLTFLALHADRANTVYAPLSATEAETFGIARLGIPHTAVLVAAPIAVALYVAALVGAFVGLRRSGASLRDLGPPAMLVATQALWFTIPSFAHATSAYAVQTLPFALIWIATAHATQYLWVTSYYVKRERGEASLAGFLTKAMLAGAAIVSVPGILFAPTLLGDVHWFAGLSVLIFAVVNLHHFVLDGAIWKLRDGRVARLLLRSDGEESEEVAPPTPARALLRPFLWAVGGVSLAISALMIWEVEVGGPGGTRDAERAELAAQRLGWIQRDNPAVWAHAARLRAEEGQVDRAIDAYQRALELDPRWQYQNNLADLLATHRASDLATAYEAIRLAEAAAEAVEERNAAVLDTLAAAYFAGQRLTDARSTARRALVLARTQGDAPLAAQIQARLVRYESARPTPPRSFLPQQ